MGGKVKCPVCRGAFELDEYLVIGDSTSCPRCNAMLTVVELYPPAVEAESEDDFPEFEEDEEEN